jgi:phage terminase large subunit
MEVLLNIKDTRRAPFLMELLRSLDYITVKKVEKENENSLFDDLSEAFEEVKLHEQGKIKLKSLKEVLNEL